MTKCSQHLVGPVRIAKLLDAARKGYNDCVKKLVKGGANVNGVSKSRMTPLVYAIQNRHQACVSSLLKLGADINFPDKVLKTPLVHAIEGGSLKVVKMLVDTGADVNTRCNKGQTVLMYALENNFSFWTEYIYQEALREKPFEKGKRRLRAASDECVKMLLEAGADVNAKTKAGSTTLMEAAQNDMVGCVEMLLKAGVDVNVADNDGNTAVSYAVDGKPECLKLLVEAGADVNGFNSRGYNLLMLAKQDIECLKILLMAGADVNAVGEHGQTALFDAVDHGLIDSVKLLLEAGADVNIRGIYGMTPLMIATTESKSRTTDTQIELVKTLIDNGADVNIVDEDGRTALHSAVLTQNIHIVEYLLESGSKVRVKDKIFGLNSLESYFVGATQTTKEMVQLLIAAGETFPKVKAKKAGRNKSGSEILVRLDSVSVRIPSDLLEDNHINLQSVCRETIRNQLLSVSSVNLFARVRGLRERLPDYLRLYLLNNVVLSTTEATPKENDDVNTDSLKIEPTGSTGKVSGDTSYFGAVPQHDTRHQNSRKGHYGDLDSDEDIGDSRNDASGSCGDGCKYRTFGDGRGVDDERSEIIASTQALSLRGDADGGGDTVSRQVQPTIHTDTGSVEGNGEDGSGWCGYENGGAGCDYGDGGVISIQIVSTCCMYCQQEVEDADGWVTTESDDDVDV